jgi:hypothetical protein
VLHHPGRSSFEARKCAHLRMTGRERARFKMKLVRWMKVMAKPAGGAG